jgi:tetratricopeptide (TPR) repeat protein
LFQRYLYERLSAAERMYLHEAMGDALEALYTDRSDSDGISASQLARHFEEAHLVEKASRYLLLAGQRASRMLAFDEAADFCVHGIALLDHVAATSGAGRLAYELRLALGRALWQGGHVAACMPAFEKAIEAARTMADPDAFARAVLAYEEPRWRLNLDADSSQRFMREALDMIGQEESALRVRLLVGLSRTLLNSGGQQELRSTVEQALQIARQIDDPAALFDALRINIQIDRRPETTPARLSAIQEMIATAESIGDKERLLDSIDLYMYDLLELGQIDQVDQKIEDLQKVADEIQQPFQLHHALVFRTMRALLKGEFEQAERLASSAADLSQQIGIAEMDGIVGIHMFTIRREQGRIGEIAPLIKFMVANNPGLSAWRPGLALILSVLDRKVECRSIFDELAADEFRSVPRDSLWVATLAYLSEVCAYLGDTERAATLYQLMLPYDGRAVVLGGATACFGAVGRFLGMLAATRSDWETAEWHFHGALALDARMEAWPWLAHSQYEFAAMLLERGCPADRERADHLLGDSARAAQKLGMTYLGEKITDLRGCYALNSAKKPV